MKTASPAQKRAIFSLGNDGDLSTVALAKAEAVNVVSIVDAASQTRPAALVRSMLRHWHRTALIGFSDRA